MSGTFVRSTEKIETVYNNKKQELREISHEVKE